MKKRLGIYYRRVNSLLRILRYQNEKEISWKPICYITWLEWTSWMILLCQWRVWRHYTRNCQVLRSWIVPPRRCWSRLSRFFPRSMFVCGSEKTTQLGTLCKYSIPFPIRETSFLFSLYMICRLDSIYSLKLEYKLTERISFSRDLMSCFFNRIRWAERSLLTSTTPPQLSIIVSIPSPTICLPIPFVHFCPYLLYLTVLNNQKFRLLDIFVTTLSIHDIII